MNNKDFILKSVQYIEDNLNNEITVIDIANSIHYSLYHFIRLFQSVTGYSPKLYLQQRRLSEAVKELKRTDRKIIEIAFDYQFNSHEAFTRSFKKQFGVNPKKIRDGLPISNLPLVNPINKEYLYQSEKVKESLPQLVELPQMLLSGISFFLRDDSKVNDLSKEWGQFTQEVNAIKNRVQPERYYQVQYWSENQDLGGLYFFIGVEVCCIDEIPPQLVVKILPKAHYLRFIHKGLANMVGHTYKYIYNQYLPETDYKLTKPFNFELYGRKNLGPYNPESESDIFIPVEPSTTDLDNDLINAAESQ